MLNRQLQFSAQALLCVTLISAIAITYWGSRRHAIDPRWREEVFYDCESLENEPSVVVDAIDRIAFDDIYRTRETENKDMHCVLVGQELHALRR
jgi:hypothetical protein